MCVTRTTVVSAAEAHHSSLPPIATSVAVAGCAVAGVVVVMLMRDNFWEDADTSVARAWKVAAAASRLCWHHSPTHPLHSLVTSLL